MKTGSHEVLGGNRSAGYRRNSLSVPDLDVALAFQDAVEIGLREPDRGRKLVRRALGLGEIPVDDVHFGDSDFDRGLEIARTGNFASDFFPQSGHCRGKAISQSWGMADFPNRIREIRKSRGWTLEQLTEQSGISRSTLSRLEVGERRMNYEHMEALASAFGVRPADLLESPDTPPAIPVLGYVGLGEEINWTGDGDQVLDFVELPFEVDFPNPMALIGVGGSMAPRVKDGEVLIASRLDGVDPMMFLNEEVIVRVVDGPCLLKTLRKGTRPGRWRLDSHAPQYEPREDVEIEWLAELRMTIHRKQWRMVNRQGAQKSLPLQRV